MYPCKLLQKTIFFCFSFFTKKTRFCLFPFFFFFVICLEIYFSCFVKCVRFKRAICHSVVHSNGQQPLRAGRSLFQSCGQEIVAGTLHCLEGGRAHESSSLEGLLQVRAGRSSPGACQERTGCWFVYTTAQHLSSTDAAARRACSALLSASLTIADLENFSVPEDERTDKRRRKTILGTNPREARNLVRAEMPQGFYTSTSGQRRFRTLHRLGEIQRWQKKKGMGIYLSDHDRDCLTNLRFADDVMLFATSKEQIRKMMCEFKKATEKVGLRIHPDKTKILSNQSNTNSDTKRYIKIGEMSIEILTRNESVKYLGQRISFHQQETLEIKSRIRAAWATFHKYRQELTSKNYMLKHRLRLFDATVSPTICYATGTWTPNKEHERMIQSTQRKMLRFIIQTGRKYKKIEKY